LGRKREKENERWGGGQETQPEAFLIVPSPKERTGKGLGKKEKHFAI
jgi:hypothetical protein